MTKNQLDYMRIQEDMRHNLQTEAAQRGQLAVEQGKLGETVRHNVQAESLSAKDILTKQAQVMLGAAQLDETARHNVATEKISRVQTATKGLNDIGNFFKSVAPIITAM